MLGDNGIFSPSYAGSGLVLGFRLELCYGFSPRSSSKPTGAQPCFLSSHLRDRVTQEHELQLISKEDRDHGASSDIIRA